MAPFLQASSGSFTTPDDEPPSTPRDLAGWVALFASKEIPVLDDTALAIEELRANEDAVDARLLAEAFSGDPLMTLKTLAHVAGLQRSRRSSDPETVTEALVMIGITPFFRDFGQQATVETHLDAHADALQGLRAVLRRSSRAARFALAFAVHRGDHDATLIHEAALLHDFAEMLLWLHAPSLAVEMDARQREDPALRSRCIQRERMNAELPDIQHALMERWRLPPMLIDISDDRRATESRSRSVLLAIRLARHSARGWDNAALPDDVSDIAELLNLNAGAVWSLLREVDTR